MDWRATNIHIVMGNDMEQDQRFIRSLQQAADVVDACPNQDHSLQAHTLKALCSACIGIPTETTSRIGLTCFVLGLVAGSTSVSLTYCQLQTLQPSHSSQLLDYAAQHAPRSKKIASP